MKHSKAHLENGRLVIDSTKEMSLTDDCWLIQFNGLSACEFCELMGTGECGGGETLKAILANVR